MSDDLPNFHLHDPGEYFNGVTKDGKPLHFPSKEMHPPFLPWQIPPGETPKLPEYSEHHKAASAHVLRTQKYAASTWRLCADMHCVPRLPPTGRRQLRLPPLRGLHRNETSPAGCWSRPLSQAKT
ncbi:MAG: hypothetical protein HS108_00085 [Planctomycetes bacterium]|nr:hypothetical protein [Planctomycetota bacterium]